LARHDEAANRPNKPKLGETRVIRSAMGRGQVAEVMVREVMRPGVPAEMVALRVTELRSTGPVVLPAGVKVGAIERPDGTLVPIVSSG
jgi:hypothetical protein